MTWGIVGYGEIAPFFMDALSKVDGQSLGGIATKSKHKLLKEREIFDKVNVFNSYEDLLNDSQIDIVYICTTNNLHKENVLLALEAKKNILCEKPICVCKKDAIEVMQKALLQKKFLMEGMWTRFLPAYRHFKELLRSEVIGQVKFARIDFGFNSLWGDDRRLKNKKLFGGTVLDNADYNVFLCQDIFREMPVKVSAFGHFIETGVEDMCGVMLQYPSGAIAQLFSSFSQATRQEALIYGEKGHIHLREYWHGTEVDLFSGEGHQTWSFPFRANGFEYEIEEVVRCIEQGKLESDIIAHDMSIQVAEIMDWILYEIWN